MMVAKRCVIVAGLFISFAAGSSLSVAAPIEPLQPLAFLAGHCWKGDFADGKRTDEHCFVWLYDGKALRDTHTVRTPGRPDYVGETTYYWDSAANRLEYLYIENAGGVSRGSVHSTAEALVFPATQYVEGGQSMTYRVRWTRLSDTSYEAWSEMQVKDGWTTMFKMTMKQSS
jgi:hypothetical protein